MQTSKNHPLRIAIDNTEGAAWTGGLTYRKNLLEAVCSYAPEVEVILISRQNTVPREESGRYQLVQYIPAGNKLSALVNKVSLKAAGFDYQLWRSLKAGLDRPVDLLFPGSVSIGKQTAILYWIPDFQFLHLPEMYSKQQVRHLEGKFREGILRANLVLLSSRDAQEDLIRFAPEFAGKARVMNFVAHVPTSVYEEDFDKIATEYHIPTKFFYLPNQFWKHKNHATVLESLKILKERGCRPFIVFTGNPVDSRHPLYFAELLQKISLYGIRDQVAFLGLVPHQHVYQLIRQSICVLNPSLFEGWSTTVEEAKSIGKRVLLSDLSVHREQNAPYASYFSPNDVEDLARQLEAIWENQSPGPDHELEAVAREALPIRMRQFARTFVDIAHEAVNSTQGHSFARKSGKAG